MNGILHGGEPVLAAVSMAAKRGVAGRRPFALPSPGGAGAGLVDHLPFRHSPQCHRVHRVEVDTESSGS